MVLGVALSWESQTCLWCVGDEHGYLEYPQKAKCHVSHSAFTWTALEGFSQTGAKPNGAWLLGVMV